jgi:hypothetical protein
VWPEFPVLPETNKARPSWIAYVAGKK